MLFVVPSGMVLNQWQEEIHTNFPHLHLTISHGDRPPATKYLANWVSATAMREAPESLKNWPQQLRYIFDRGDARASRTVMLTAYDTHVQRTLNVRRVPKGQKSEGSRKVFSSGWTGRFSLVVLDEGHRV